MCHQVIAFHSGAEQLTLQEEVLPRLHRCKRKPWYLVQCFVWYLHRPLSHDHKYNMHTQTESDCLNLIQSIFPDGIQTTDKQVRTVTLSMTGMKPVWGACTSQGKCDHWACDDCKLQSTSHLPAHSQCSLACYWHSILYVMQWEAECGKNCPAQNIHNAHCRTHKYWNFAS